MGALVKGILAAMLAVPVSLLCMSGVASAAVVSGSVEDARGDVPEIDGEYHPRDLRSLAVTYDEERGVVQFTVTHWDPHTYESGYLGDHFFAAGADVGFARPDGSCDATSTGGLQTRMTTPTDYTEPGHWASASVVGEDLTIFGDVGGAVLANLWTYTLAGPALSGRGYDCVTNLRVRHHGTDTVDTGEDFCMGPSGTAPCREGGLSASALTAWLAVAGRGGDSPWGIEPANS